MPVSVSLPSGRNASIDLEQAGIGERIVATLIDFVLLFFTGIVYVTVFGFLFSGSDVLYTTFMILFALYVFLYDLLFELAWNGQTPGKRIRGIRVVRLDGRRPGFSEFALRWVFRPIEVLISQGTIAAIAIVVSKNQQRLGDLAAGTIVIVEPKQVLLSTTVLRKLEKNYQPGYPQAAYLPEKSIRTLQKVLNTYRSDPDNINHQRILAKAAEKLAQRMKVQSTEDEAKFIYRVIKDYNFYHQEEKI
jgi:uncharacterized RDD family membrane protein YckC